VDAPKFKDYILPLVFLKRLSDVFDDEIDHLAHEFGDRQMAATLVEQDHQLVRRRSRSYATINDEPI
jgi:type I restriction enzyme M protein